MSCDLLPPIVKPTTGMFEAVDSPNYELIALVEKLRIKDNRSDAQWNQKYEALTQFISQLEVYERVLARGVWRSLRYAPAVLVYDASHRWTRAWTIDGDTMKPVLCDIHYFFADEVSAQKELTSA